MNEMRKLIEAIEEINEPNDEMLHRLTWLEEQMVDQLNWIEKVEANERQRNPSAKEIARTAIGLIRFVKEHSPN